MGLIAGAVTLRPSGAGFFPCRLVTTGLILLSGATMAIPRGLLPSPERVSDMAHIGVICPPIPGHLDPLAAVGRTLAGRGHRVTVFQVADLAKRLETSGLGFVPLGPDRFPPGTLPWTVAKLASLKGAASLKFAIACACQASDLILSCAPDAIRAAGVDALVVDQNEPAGASVAQHLRLPFVSACTSLPLNREPAIPPPFVGWPFQPTVVARMRNRLGYLVADRFIAPIQRTLNGYRRQWHLPELASPDDSFSTLAQIAQMPREFDFPRERLPPTFHYLGPWFDDRLAPVPFPFDALDGRPIVYASLGTLQPEQSPYFRVIAGACAVLDVQLVLSLGAMDRAPISDLPGRPIVLSYAPQTEILARAAATITHAGMNTTQQSLYFGVPMVAIPLAHDQPAIAARTARSGAGLVLPPSQLSVGRLQAALRAVLDPSGSFRNRAQALAASARAAGGRERAADVIERVLPT